MSTTSMSDKFFILCSSMKYIFPLLLSSVLLTSGSALAQGSPSSDTEELSRPTLTTPAEAVISTTVSTPDSKVAQAESKSDDTVSSEQILVPLNGTEQVSLELVKRGSCPNASQGSKNQNNEINLLNFPGKVVDIVWNSRCPVDRFLADLFFPESATREEWELLFDNRGPKSVIVLNTAVEAQGKQPNNQLTSNARNIYVGKKVTSEDIDLPANQIVSLPLTIDLSTIPPDEYDGTIFLTIEGGQKIKLPLKMNVRTSPLLPFVVLVIGIILGWVSNYMKGSGKLLVDARNEINRLRYDINKADNLSPKLKNKLLKRVDEARNLVDRQDFDTFKQEEKKIRDMLKGPEPIEENDEVFEELKKDTLTDEKAEEEKNTRDLGQGVSNRRKKIRMFRLNFTDRTRSEATFRIAQPLVPILLVIGLSAVGINSLYIDKKTFGAQPFPDYLNLIVWGLSADLASRSLTDLPGAMAKKQ